MPRPISLSFPIVLALLVLGCRPDPYSLFLRTIEPGEEVALPDGMTLVAGEREGAVLRDVRITGRARTCEGTMEIEAREVRIEPAKDGRGPLLVLSSPVAHEHCGATTATTRHDRLVLDLSSIGAS